MAVKLRIEMRHILPQWIFDLLYYASEVASLAKSQPLSQLGRRYRSVFSGEKISQRIFCPKTLGSNVEVLSLRVNFLKGLCK